LPPENYNKKSLHLLCGVLDQSKEGRISFSEFQTFEGKTEGRQRESKRDTGQVYFCAVFRIRIRINFGLLDPKPGGQK
jgi:hypothetical protein